MPMWGVTGIAEEVGKVRPQVPGRSRHTVHPQQQRQHLPVCRHVDLSITVASLLCSRMQVETSMSKVEIWLPLLCVANSQAGPTRLVGKQSWSDCRCATRCSDL